MVLQVKLRMKQKKIMESNEFTPKVNILSNLVVLFADRFFLYFKDCHSFQTIAKDCIKTIAK